MEMQEICEDEFDALETELIIDYLKKHSPEERQLLANRLEFVINLKMLSNG